MYSMSVFIATHKLCQSKLHNSPLHFHTKKFLINSSDCSVKGPISRSAVSCYVAIVSHQSKLTASSSIQGRHQLKPVELNIVLWYIYILKLDLIILAAESSHRGPPSLNAHTSLPSIKIWMGHKGQGHCKCWVGHRNSLLQDGELLLKRKKKWEKK